MSKKELLLKVHQAETRVLESVKNANLILDILKILQSHVNSPDTDSSGFEVALKCIQSIRTIIQTFKKNGDLRYPRHVSKQQQEEDQGEEECSRDAMDQFQDWMWKNVVAKFEDMLLSGIHASDEKQSRLQLICLNTLIMMVKMEADALLIEKENIKRPQQMEALFEFLTCESGLFYKLVRTIVCSEGKVVPKAFLKEMFLKYVGEYQDVRYALMHILTDFISRRSELGLDQDSAFRRNAFNILIRYRTDADEDFSRYVYLTQIPAATLAVGVKRSMDADSEQKQMKPASKLENVEDIRNNISTCWMKVLSDHWKGEMESDPLPMDLLRLFLLHVEDAVFPNLSSPVKLADFLTASYNMGGVISIMALNGLFILMNSFNFSYPDFYCKLYKLLDSEILYTQHRDKFFSLCFLFLKSSHIPGFMLAAFVKKLARIALCAPAAGALVCLRIIFNLLRRNASLRVLVHRSHLPCASGSAEYSQDPLLDFEDFQDPEKCQKLLQFGSLWEIKTLSEHYAPEVATESLVILETSDWPAHDRDVAEILDQSFNDLFDKRVQKKHGNNCALNFKAPKTFFKATNAAFSCGLTK